MPQLFSNLARSLLLLSMVALKQLVLGSQCETLYSCQLCLEGSSCEWCISSYRCLDGDTGLKDCEMWINGSARYCPKPKIINFFPENGTWEGGTNITIEGHNLGIKFNDIASAVTVAGQKCIPYADLYVEAERIVCRVSRLEATGMKAGPVVVTVAGVQANSTKQFKYVDPKIQTSSPVRGPMYGGTLLTLLGDYLDVGNTVEVFIADTKCEIMLKESSRLQCRTGAFSKNGTFMIIVQFDGAERVYFPGFSYVDNPQVFFDKDKPIKGITAGGLKATVAGKMFDVVEEASMYVLYSNGSVYSSPCNVSVDVGNAMICDTPVFPMETNFFEEDFIRLNYGFVLDLIILPAPNNTMGDYSFHLFPNPYFNRFEEQVRKYESGYLTLNGRDLNAVATKDDFIVWIGGGICDIISVSSIQLLCKPPDQFNSSNIFPVRVKVGSRLTYVIGNLEYVNRNSITDNPLFLPGLVGGIVSVVFVGIIVILVYKRRKPIQYEQLSRESLEEFLNGSLPREDGVEDVGLTQDVLRLPYDRSLELRVEDFNIGWSELLGEGEFGKVYKGTVHGISVAFKVPSSNCSFTHFKSLLCEIKMMSYVGRHENILSLVGAYTAKLHKGVVYIATDLCEGGSLKQRLMCMKIGFDFSKGLNRLLHWLYQIASGMAFLALKNIVHRDLAARNVLLASNDVIKVSDFGLSRRLYDVPIYQKSGNEPLPLRWMAIEVLKYLEYSEKSDVWAFGVTMWEVFTLGDVPYSGLSRNVNIADALEDGLRLPQPSDVPQEIYNLMSQCWASATSDRPCFQSLQEKLETFLSSRIEYVEVSDVDKD